MKVLIHALGADMGGAVRHLSNFFPQLAAQDSTREYVVIVRKSFPIMELPNNFRIERLNDEDSSSWIKRIIYDVFFIPLRLKKENFSAIVSITNFGPIWSPVPHIFFQCNALYYCSYYLDRISGRLKIETMLRRALAIASIKRANLIVTPSFAMENMIRTNCPKTQLRKFHTLYHGFDTASLSSALDDKYLQLFKLKKGVKLFYPTHAASHKGFDVLFEILAKLKADGVDFCLFTTISYDDWPDGVREFELTIKKLDLTENIIFMGRVPQRQMGNLYKECDLMVYPSLCESFGFSMIEAMGFGLPIVAADTAINREICGNSAIYYSPLDASAGLSAIKKALNPEIAQGLRESANQLLKSYDWSWKRYAKEFLDIINRVS